MWRSRAKWTEIERRHKKSVCKNVVCVSLWWHLLQWYSFEAIESVSECQANEIFIGLRQWRRRHGEWTIGAQSSESRVQTFDSSFFHLIFAHFGDRRTGPFVALNRGGGTHRSPLNSWSFFSVARRVSASSLALALWFAVVFIIDGDGLHYSQSESTKSNRNAWIKEWKAEIKNQKMRLLSPKEN